MKYAYYSDTRKVKTLVVHTDLNNRTIRPDNTYVVSGIREARRLCKELNARPWNF